jgi:hypothetical protein
MPSPINDPTAHAAQRAAWAALWKLLLAPPAAVDQDSRPANGAPAPPTPKVGAS